MKTLLKYLVIVCIICFLPSFFSCSSIKPVTISGVENFRTENALSKPEFKFDIGVKNPNNFGVTLKRMGIALSLNDSTLAEISIHSKTRIAAHSEIKIPLTLSPSVNNLANILMNGIKNIFSDVKKQQMQLKGEIVVRKFIFIKKIKIKEAIRL